MRRTAGLLLPLLLALAACGSDDDDDDGPRYTGAIAYEALHYDVALDLTTRRTHVEVTLHTTSDGDCVDIGMRAVGAESVTLGGHAAAALAQTDGRLHACDGAAHGWPSGADVVLAVTTSVPEETEGVLDVGLSTQTDAAGGRFTYLVSWLNGCDLHGPCDARPGTFATYRFEVTHDDATQVLCSGRVAATPTRTTCTFDYPGGPTYSTYGVIARSPAWTKLPLGDWSGVATTLYDRPGSQIAAKLDVASVQGGFAWLVEHLGAYPYGDELRFVVGPTHWAGFEHPGNIALGDFLGTSGSAYADGLAHTAIHELVHMWAGDQATLASTYDFAWKEAMAEYLTFVIEDEQGGAAISDETAAYWKAIAPSALHYAAPEDDPLPALSVYYGDAYGPGPMILFRQLEVMFSRAQVLDAIVALVGSGQPRVLSIADVEAELARATGADLDAYFDAWLHGSGRPAWPEVSATPVETVAGSGTWTVAVAATGEVTSGCRFHVRLVDADAHAADFVVTNGPAGGAYVAPEPRALDFTPTDAIVDPLHECLVYEAGAAKPDAPRHWMR